MPSPAVPRHPEPAPTPAGFPDLTGRIILQVIPELAAGGAERTVLEIAEALRTAGATALVASRGGRLVADLERLGGEHIALDAKSKNLFVLQANARRLKALIGERRIDLVHARSRAPAWSAFYAARAAGIPFVTTYHGAYSGTGGLKRFYNSVMARGDVVIANSSWIADHIRKIHGVEDDRLVTIRRGVDLIAFDPAAISEERVRRVREAWGLTGGEARTVLLLPGRLTEWKGQRLAVEALGELTPEERSRLTLILAGDPQGREAYGQRLKAAVDALGGSADIRVPGHCHDMPAAYRAADIVLCPSTRPEAFGRVAAEASAMGRPVIASDHGGARETVIDGQTGARVTPGSATALAAAIRALTSLGPQTWAGMGEAGRAHIAANFSKRGLQAKTLGVYAGLLAKQ